jgi:hypothetical protein
VPDTTDPPDVQDRELPEVDIGTPGCDLHIRELLPQKRDD